MESKREDVTAGISRMSGLLDWWGVEGNQAVGEPIKRFQQLASGLRHAYSEAYAEELDALTAANDRLAKSVQGLLRSRKSDEFFSAQMDIFAGLMESASRQVTNWSELSRKIQQCCATVAQEAAEDMRHHGEAATEAATERAADSMREEQQRLRRAARESARG
ncbi:MAG TPA: hypothetical protein VN766_17935 [Stellaceae bacterium]|jgi:hypothetical protein|nr:hypothetical protein [Stellaceae bacterium]